MNGFWNNMKLKLPQSIRVFGYIEGAHIKVFGHRMSEEMRIFLRNFSWSFSAGLLVAIIMFFVNIMAGRFLGPLEFGKYNYVLSLATSSTFFFLLGNNQSSIRFVSDTKYLKRRNRLLSALFSLTIFQSVIFFVATILFGNWLAIKFNVGIATVYFIFFLGLIFSLKELLDSFLRSLGLFKEQSMAKVGDAILVLSAFFIFLFSFRERLEYFHYALSMIIGAIFSLGFFCYLTYHRFEKFGREEIVTVLHYNKFLVIGGVSGLLMTLEKVFIGKYIGVKELGIYSAYYASSQMVISNLAIIFMNIFWPMVIMNRNALQSVIAKLTKVFFHYLPFWVILNFCSIAFFLTLYGKQYPFYLSFLVLFSSSSLLNVFFFVFMSILNVDRIFHSIIVSTVVNVLLILSIVFFKSIPVYLVFQIVIYSLGIFYVRRNILNDLAKKV